jgi:diketogulonate reductase-like aldo/keto reductase
MAYRPFYAAGRSEKYGLNLFKEPIIEELAQKYGKSPAQIVLRYLVIANYR